MKHDSFIPIALENSLVKPANQDLLTDGTDPIADVTQALQWAAESEKDEVVSYFDPEDDKVTTPPDSVPSRSWKMSDETKRWVTIGHTPEEQASLLRQIANAENEKKMQYFISVPTAYYEIEYGLVKGGGKGA
ncbi:MAG TPA: hypothetical protein PKJ91_00415 [Methanoregulaceae archaeon]|nr:hypothetical protein [Methanoregulaceae archaeon]